MINFRALAVKAVNRLGGKYPPGVTRPDAIQEAYAEILRWKDREPPEGVGREPFLVMKAWGTMMDKYGREWEKFYAARGQPVTSPLLAPDTRERDETVMDVQEAIAKLTPQKARIMTLTLANWSQTEIGVELGLSQTCVSALFREAKEELRTLLKDYA